VDVFSVRWKKLRNRVVTEATRPWVGGKEIYHLQLPKGLTVLEEAYCVPSEEESFNEGVRDLAGKGIASK
jgi:hypothetical protein